MVFRGNKRRLAVKAALISRRRANIRCEVQNLIWVGLLEDIQNIASHRSFTPDVFRAWLGPQSLIAWDDVNRGMQKVAEWTSQQRRRDDGSPSVGSFDPEAALSQVENPELRRIIEQMYRKKS